jgi:SprT protein
MSKANTINRIKSILTEETKRIVKEANNTYWEHQIDFDNIEIRHTLRGTTAGRALYISDRDMKLWYHPKMAEKDLRNYVMQTLYHEVAHLYTRKMYPRSRSHGIEFIQICKAIGGNGGRTHNLNTQGLKQKKSVKRFIYACPSCGKRYELTSHKHKKQSLLIADCPESNVGYICKKCRIRLQFSNTVKDYDNITGKQIKEILA